MTKLQALVLKRNLRRI